MKKELTDDDITHMKHDDFKNSKHDKNCKCGYCELKKLQFPIEDKKTCVQYYSKGV